MKTTKRNLRPSVAPPVHPNCGLELEYRRRLLELIGQMHNSVLYWLAAAYRANPPRMAQDGPTEDAAVSAEWVAATRMLGAPMAQDAEWVEADHPRDEAGRFGEGGLPTGATIKDLGNGSYSVKHAGREIATAHISDNGDYLSAINVDPEYRRQGIGTALKKHIEQHSGKTLKPAPYLTPSGKAFTESFEKRRAAKPAGGVGSKTVMRPEGWTAGSDDVYKITRPGHLYRGMTEAEFNATIGAGHGLKSSQAFSTTNEGTSLADNAETAESYANYGRDDPRKTGKPTYLVEVAGHEGAVLDKDGYYKAQGEIHPSRLSRIWKMQNENGAVVATLMKDSSMAQDSAVFAQDDAPAVILRRIMRALARRWQARFNELAPDLAEYFATNVSKRVDGALTAILVKHGFAVRFQSTALSRDVLAATTGENVALIKSIPQRYFTDIETEVMRSAAAGRDLQTLTEYLGPKVRLDRIGLGRRPGESNKSLAARTERRAELIARDQNNKATATRIRVRQHELGITEAIWVHSGGGREPRPDHVAWGAARKRYKISEGMWSEKEQQYIFPGELINCRCVSRSVIPGLGRMES